jgi:Uncharacterized conserved protein (DUF2190)
MASMDTFRSYKAEATVEGFRIVKAGSADLTAIKATGATDALLGTSDALDKATGEMVDVSLSPLAEVRLGGTVTRGAPLTSDANGKAVATSTAGNRIIGYAEASGVADDVIPYLRALGVY